MSFQWLLIGLGGFIGALARYGLSSWIHRSAGGSFPAGTLVVNLVGCLCIGVAIALIERYSLFSSHLRPFLIIGILGSFTTFSTFGYETLMLLKNGAVGIAAGNIAMNVVLGLVGVWLGFQAIRAFS